MAKDSLIVKCIDSEDITLNFSLGELLVDDENGNMLGYKKGLIIRKNYMDIQEHETDLISMEDIPELIAFLQEQIK